MEYIEQDLSKEEQDVHSSGTSVIPSYKPEPNPASYHRTQVKGTSEAPQNDTSILSTLATQRRMENATEDQAAVSGLLTEASRSTMVDACSISSEQSIR